MVSYISILNNKKYVLGVHKRLYFLQCTSPKCVSVCIMVTTEIIDLPFMINIFMFHQLALLIATVKYFNKFV
jgi:hypothetical protein